MVVHAARVGRNRPVRTPAGNLKTLRFHFRNAGDALARLEGQCSSWGQRAAVRPLREALDDAARHVEDLEGVFARAAA